MKCLFIILFVIISIPLLAGDFLISGGAFSHTYPVTSYNGDNYQVVWVDKRDYSSYYGFYGRQVSREGTPIGTDAEIEEAYGYLSFMPDIAFGGTQNLFVWSRYRGYYGPGDAYGKFVGLDGNPIGIKFRISIGNSVSANFPHVAWDGTNFLVVWQLGSPNSGCKIQGQFISSSGTLVGNNFDIRPTGMATSVDQIYPAVKFDGTNYLVVWDDDRNGDRDIYGQLVGTDGSMIGDDFSISTAGNDQMLVDLAWSGSGYCAVWQDDRWDTSDASIFGQLINQNGTLNGENFCIYHAPSDSGCGWPAVGSSGDSYLAGWHKEYLEYDKDEPLSVEQQLINTAAGLANSRPVVWYDVYAQKISLMGSLVDDLIPVCTQVYHQEDVHISSSGDNYLIVWQDSRNGNQYYVVYGSLIEDIPVSLDDPPSESLTMQISPNPVQDQLYIHFSQPTASKVSLELYNVLGQHIGTLEEGNIQAGSHELTLKTNLPNGVYFVSMITQYQHITQKFVIMR